MFAHRLTEPADGFTLSPAKLTEGSSMSAAAQVTQLRDIEHDCSPEEWAARLDLAAAYRLGARMGWHDMLGNHFTLRVPGTTDQYLLNPLGLFFEEITASSLVKMDTKGNILSDAPNGINKAGEVIHGGIYAARPDVASVMHLHSPAGAGVSAQKDGLLPISQNALILMDRIRYHEYEGPASNAEDERRALARDLADGSILFLRNHGTLTAGRTMGETFVLMGRVERACEIQLAAQAGSAVHYPTQDAIDRTRAIGAKMYGDNSRSPGASLEWAAFRRKLDREDPGYAA
jgi:ribulose-5-phosphate 4-epimerase/fuculose-1-phosphate aldolase